MDLFPADLLSEITEMDGAGHSFLKQLSDPSGLPIRERLCRVVDLAPPVLRDRWTDSLRSLDNRRFFQGFSEVTTAAFLQESGWTLTGIDDPGPCLTIERSTDDGGTRRARVMVLAFIQTGHHPLDTAAIERLVQVVDHTDAKSRIAILVRKWLPHDFDPLPIRRAIDMWLREVDHGRRDGRYASYDDENISLEFALTDTKVQARGGIVSFAIGPLDGFRTLEIVETRLIYELDAHRIKSHTHDPLIVCLATNTTWCLSPGFLRSLLYGRPTSHVINGVPYRQEFRFGPDVGPALFRDPVYNSVSATMVLEQHPDQGPCARTYLNPWAEQAFTASDTACAAFGVDRWEGDTPVMRWFE
jgi:hypothetical protein